LAAANSGKYPQFANDYFKGRPQFYQPGKAGEGFRTMMYLNDFSDKMSHYPAVHEYLKGLHEKHGNDARGFMNEYMADKNNEKLPANHPARLPFGISTKTGRYAGLMMGKGNAVVNDTHLMRHLFGLQHDISPNEPRDTAAINYLKRVLSAKHNYKLINDVDEAYMEHPAVRQVQKEYFGGKRDPQAIGPGFWRHWLTIAPHERSKGWVTRSEQEGTTHEPYWRSVNEILDRHGLGPNFKKSEQDPVYVRTAHALKEIQEKHGQNAAELAYYSHMIPALLTADGADQQKGFNDYMKSHSTPPEKDGFNFNPAIDNDYEPVSKEEKKPSAPTYTQEQWHSMSYNDKKAHIKRKMWEEKNPNRPSLEETIANVVASIKKPLTDSKK
jgi:hypothetical protein